MLCKYEILESVENYMEKEIFLTFDMDWASDELMEWFYSYCLNMEVKGTLFVTNEFNRLSDMKNEGNFEMGVHPNFNKILMGEETRDLNVSDVIKQIKAIVSDAVSVRSHALTSSSVIQSLFAKNSLLYDVNMFYEPNIGDRITPFKNMFGVTQIPFVFEDDIWFSMKKNKGVDYYLSGNFEAPLIFNFHPIHLYLNTDRTETYDKAKKYYKEYLKLSEYVNCNCYGARDFFNDLVQKTKGMGYTFKTIKEKKWSC